MSVRNVPVLVRAVAVAALAAGLALASGCGGGKPAQTDAEDTPPPFPTDVSSPDSGGTPPSGSTTSTNPGTPGSTGVANPPGGGAPATACSLVTAQEAAAALTVASVNTSSGSAEECLYSSGQSAVIVGWSTDTDRSAADSLVSLGGKKVDGLGDLAVQVEAPPTSQVYVWVGDHRLLISVTLSPGDPSTAARSLAQQAVARARA